MKNLKICHLSDIHLEFEDGSFIYENGLSLIDYIGYHTPKCDLIVLAGDVGVFSICMEDIKLLIKTLLPKAKKILYIPGNHEYYKASFEQGQEAICTLREDFPNDLIIADHFTSFYLNEYLICGGTLWFEKPSDPQLKAHLNDFAQTKNLESYIYDLRDNFIENLDKLKFESPNTPIIIASHHAPSFNSIPPKYAISSINRFFANNLDSYILDIKPKIWIHGHVHTQTDYTLNKTRIVANPLGYPWENTGNWEPEVIELTHA